MSLADKRAREAAAFKVARCEIRDGRRYVDGVDVGPAIPEQHGSYTRKGGERPRRGRR